MSLSMAFSMLVVESFALTPISSAQDPNTTISPDPRIASVDKVGVDEDFGDDFTQRDVTELLNNESSDSSIGAHGSSDLDGASRDENYSSIVPAGLACAFVVVLLVPLALWRRKRQRPAEDMAEIAEPKLHVKKGLPSSRQPRVIFRRNWSGSSSVVDSIDSTLHWDECNNNNPGVINSHSRLQKEATSNSHVSSIFSADTDNDETAKLNHFDACCYAMPAQAGGECPSRFKRPILGNEDCENIDVRVPQSEFAIQGIDAIAKDTSSHVNGTHKHRPHEVVMHQSPLRPRSIPAPDSNKISHEDVTDVIVVPAPDTFTASKTRTTSARVDYRQPITPPCIEDPEYLEVNADPRIQTKDTPKISDGKIAIAGAATSPHRWKISSAL
eukprot:m.177708 g.177708  ORF g.177708 m.177708 type:complete len:385 (+) comp18378_c0_seq1:197-1351(+)